MCFALSSSAKPISVHEGVHYATAPAYSSYTTSPLHTYAVPRVVAPIVSAPVVSPVYHTPVYKDIEPEPYDPNPEYSYSYGVNDPQTGDSKHAEETLKDGVVIGSYSLAEPDGTIRKVSYTADKINGFNAVVERQGTPRYAPPTKYVPPLKYVAAAPIAKYIAPAPIYHAPVAKYVAPATVYHAPIAKYIAPAPIAKYIAPAPIYNAPVAKYIAPAYHAPVYTSYHG